MKKRHSLLESLSLGPDRKSVEKTVDSPDRESVEEAIDDLYQKIHDISGSVLEDQHIAELPVRIFESDMTGQESENSTSESISCFKPMSDEVYKGYTIFEKEDASETIETLGEPYPGLDPIHVASGLSSELAWFVNCAHLNEIPRDEDGFMSTLNCLTGWLFQQSLYDYGIDVNYFHRIFNSRRTIPETRKKAVFPGFDLEKEEKLLRVEALAILAGMKSRFQDARLKKHVTFSQIMLFSFMGEYGRVIQAYYDGQDLVIRKSRLLSFRNSPATTLGLFVRHVANTPVGDTQRLPKQIPKQPKDCTVNSNVETDVHQESPKVYTNGLPKRRSIGIPVVSVPPRVKRKWHSVFHRDKKLTEYTGKRAIAQKS
ncbi:hypothetical protein DPV78_001688 [Talaromyces pinophilus]|nr:hypothetical protein DPV78_001688 [Talaromyces pinophilus]